MIPVIVAAVIAIGVASTLIFGVGQVVKKRPMSIVDYPELPAPAPDQSHQP